MAAKPPTPEQRAAITRAIRVLDDVPPRLRSNQAQLADSGSGPYVARLGDRLKGVEQRSRQTLTALRTTLEAGR